MLRADTFGLLIAFLLPGFICLSGLALTWPEVASWLINFSATAGPSVGGFLYAALVSLALGLLISAIRWALIDTVFKEHLSELSGANFGALSDPNKMDALRLIVESHYRFYQYYSNTLISIAVTYPLYYFFSEGRPSPWLWVPAATICAFLYFGAKDALIKYVTRAKSVLDS